MILSILCMYILDDNIVIIDFTINKNIWVKIFNTKIKIKIRKHFFFQILILNIDNNIYLW